jgi:Spy/CpxP family protein refolding chaperone
MQNCTKYKKCIWIGLGVAVLSLGIAFGKQQFDQCGNKGHPFFNHVRKHKLMANHLVRFLDLTEEQGQQMKELFAGTHEQMDKIHAEKEKAHRVLLEEFVSDEFDAAYVENLVSDEDIALVRSLFAETVAGVHDILTTEQREKLVAHIKDHRAMMEE